MKKQVTKAASMSDAAKTGDTPFNLDQLRQLFELMEKHGVNTVNLHSSGERWRVQRGLPQGGAPVFAAPQMPTYAPPPAVQPQPAASAVVAASSGGDSSGELIIKSPTVGTFYVSPTPEDPPFVSIGSTVSSQTIVCIIEAMKVFNQIPAELSGTITAMLVKNGDPVEFGQPLFRVKP